MSILEEITATDLSEAKDLYFKHGAPPLIYKKGVEESGAFILNKQQPQQQWILSRNEQGFLVGMVRINMDDGTISELVVDPTFRRRGIGTILLRRCLDLVGSKLHFSVIHDNLDAICFYNKMPFLHLSNVTNHVSQRDGRQYQLLHYIFSADNPALATHSSESAQSSESTQSSESA